MKKIICTMALCAITLMVKSQTASVEKSTFGIQTGYLGIYAHNESKLSNSIALRSEIGFDSGILISDFYEGTKFIMAPVITIEPRFYYNLNKRVKKSRSIEGNSGSFIALSTRFHPDWFVISNQDNVRVISDISIIPTWGIKRNIGRHFTYETGIGVGYQYAFRKQAGFQENKSYVAINLHLRIGYRF